jgi:hypothetical protein
MYAKRVIIMPKDSIIICPYRKVTIAEFLIVILFPLVNDFSVIGRQLQLLANILT